MVAAYIAEVARLAGTGKTTEHSFRGALGRLLDALAPGLKAVNEPKRTDCGAPDYIVQNKAGAAVFFVEAKDLGDGDLDGKKRTGHKEQFDRYKAALDTIIFTDYLDFRLYRHGQPAGAVRIADWDGTKVSGRPSEYAALAALVAEASSAAQQRIDSAKKLAGLMAAKARMLQRAAEAYLKPLAAAHDSAAPGLRSPVSAPLLSMLLDFRTMLMPEVGAADFSDIFAQTLTYGMFAARLNDTTPENFSRVEAAKLIPRSNPFLRQLFQYIDTNLEDELEWVVDDLAELFAATDVAGIMRDYGKTTGTSDPMVHFYEDFLAAYDAGLRKERGVWYTPIQVVKFIVGAVDWALKNSFGIADGLADASTTEIEVEEAAAHGKMLSRKVKRAVHRVQMLDPATGTATFLAETVRKVRENFAGNEGMWPGYVEQSLLPRLNGFELMMASYAMAHVKLDYVLKETGAAPTGKERFRVFLADSLSDWHKELPGGLFAAALGAEQQGADEVKRDIPVMVVMGNPPYSGESQNKGDWIMRRMEDYKVEPGGMTKLMERNPKWLNDDYVKFIRLAEHYVEKNGSGIVAYITPHGFLDNPTFRGMRWHLMQTFDEIWTLNLHGNSKKKEVAPDGGKDECVFAIQQGVAITLFVKNGERGTGGRRSVAAADGTEPVPPCRVYYTDLWGRRKSKLAALESATMDTIKWQELHPAEPMLFFTPRDTSAEAEWNAGFGIADLMKVNSVSVVTANDRVLVDFNGRKLAEKVSTAYNATPDSTKIEHYAYRPFDERYIYYDVAKIERPREKVMRHFLATKDTKNTENLCEPLCSLWQNNSSGNVALLTCRQLAGNDWSHAFIAEHMVDDNCVSNKSKERGYVFPLYLYEENMGKVERRANLDPAIVARIEARVLAQEYYNANRIGATWRNVSMTEDIAGLEPLAVSLDGNSDRSTAKAFFKSFAPARNEHDGRILSFTVSAAKKMTASRSFNIFGIAREIPRIFSVSRLAWSENATDIPNHKEHRNILWHHQYVAKIAVGEGVYYIRLTVRENSGTDGRNEMHGTTLSSVCVYETKDAELSLRTHAHGEDSTPLNRGAESSCLRRTQGEDSASFDGGMIPFPPGGVNGRGGEKKGPFVDWKMALFLSYGRRCKDAEAAEETKGTLAPEDVFNYVYGVLHSPVYRAKFKEFLKSDFPRIPYPKDAAEFRRLAAIGERLVAVHLLKDPKVRVMFSPYANFPVVGSNRVEMVRFEISATKDTKNTENLCEPLCSLRQKESAGRVCINDTQYFDNVPQTAWEMPIGGYRPAQKWLKDRKGRALSLDDIRHYRRIVMALLKT